MKSLDQEIQEHYNGKRLSEAQLKSILDRKNTPKRPLLGYTIAASVIIALCYVFIIHPYLNDNRIVKSYAEEVAYNHLKHSPMEVVSDKPKDLNQNLPKLNFKVSYNDRLSSFGKLVGGRYCHVDDQIAAQLRIIDDVGRPLTCYQFKQQYEINFDKIVETKGVNVHIWNQDSIVFAVAEIIED